MKVVEGDFRSKISSEIRKLGPHKPSNIDLKPDRNYYISDDYIGLIILSKKIESEWLKYYIIIDIE